MNIITLTWNGGENNPFEYFSHCIRKGLEKFGAHCTDVAIDNSLADKINEFSKRRIDAIITFQGLCSNLQDAQGSNVWDKLKVPFVSLHGDHPSHMTINHSADSSSIHHLYAFPSHSGYANKYFTRKESTSFYMMPNVFRQAAKERPRTGKFFVFPKNIDDVTLTKQEWKEKLHPDLSKFFIMSAEEIESNYKSGDLIEHHELIDTLLTESRFGSLVNALKIENVIEFFHFIHGVLDKVYRNVVSESLIVELKDVPMEIYGRGWDRFKTNASPCHIFKDFTNLSDGDFQYFSEYGIIDVSPVRDGLHDRSFRAMANDSGFLSNCNFDFYSSMGDRGENLFYTGRAGSLRNLAEIVMDNPLKHRARASQFSNSFDKSFSMYGFYSFLKMLKSR
jgi:hypothetical protein